MRLVPLLALAALAVPATVLAEQAAPKVYVVKPGLVDVPDTALPAILDAIGQAAADEGVQALTENDVATLLRSQATLQALGADADELSLSSLGKAVGATHLVTATIAKVKDDTQVSCRLVDVANAAVLARRTLLASEHGGGLLEAVRVATRLALAPVFKDRQGTLTLTVSESGADVLLDGDVVAVTPASPLQVPGGTHVVGVRKERFVSYRETLRIVGGETLDRLVRLRPSPDFLRTYKEDAGRMRVVAWSGTAVLVAGAAVAVLFVVKRNESLAEVTRLDANYAALSPADQLAQEATYNHDRGLAVSSADQSRLFSILGGAAGGVGLLSGGFGWLFGNDPGRYDDLEKEVR